MVRPCSRQTSTRRVASAASDEPQPATLAREGVGDRCTHAFGGTRDHHDAVFKRAQLEQVVEPHPLLDRRARPIEQQKMNLMNVKGVFLPGVEPFEVSDDFDRIPVLSETDDAVAFVIGGGVQDSDGLLEGRKALIGGLARGGCAEQQRRASDTGEEQVLNSHNNAVWCLFHRVWD